MVSLNFPEILVFEKAQNGKENGKVFSMFPKCKILSKQYCIWLTEHSRDSRNGTERDCPDFPAIPAHPIRGGRERERDLKFNLVRLVVNL